MMFAGEIDLSSTTGLRQSGLVEREKARCLALQRLAEAAILLRDGGKIGGDYQAALRLKELDDGRGSRERRRRWLLRQMDPLAIQKVINHLRTVPASRPFSFRSPGLNSTAPRSDASYQAQLQRNLLYLAAIADAQPQAHAVRPQQMMPQGGGHFMQQAPPVFPPRVPLQFPQQRPEQLHHQVQAMPFQVQMDLRTTAMNDMHPHAAAALRQSHDGQGSKQDASPADLGAREAEQSHAKTP
ncbi:hypothetical protein B296_00028329 [Ensete ventricosum]|uniref:Uncharacterized protein n=1 Tax=Ensete ventricosum TaxID=4639 RepID=A0A426Y556_ENSVE|nr:hypothetical protein B296_00028329 [Ensete ventricosum]